MSVKKLKIASPCVSICIYDENRTCTGCMRTEDERKKWKNKETKNSWKKRNLNEIQKRMSKEFLASWKSVYKRKVQRLIENEKP